MDSARPPSHAPVWVVGSLALVVAACAFVEAVRFYGHPFAGVLVDPNAVISDIGPNGQERARLGLKFPTRVVAVDGVSLSSEKGASRGGSFDAAIERAARERRREVSVRVESGAETRGIVLPVRRLDGITWWTLSGVLFFAGALQVAQGLIALWVSPRGRLARTWAKLTAFSALFLFTLFDFHTSRSLVPLFFVAFAFVPVGLVMLALRLPDDVPLLSRWPWFERALDALAAAAAAGFIATWAAGESTRVLQMAWSPVFVAAFLFFVVVFVVRFLRARGERRAVLRPLLFAMVPPLAVVGLSNLHGRPSWIADYVVFPALSLPPLATAYAFVRHDIWGSRALLSRILTNVFVAAMVAALAVGLGTALAIELGAPLPAALSGAAAAGVVTAILVAVGLAAVERQLFPALAEYKPTIEQLSEQLINITSPQQVARAMEHNVRRWLPCDLVELELEQPDESADADRQSGSRRRDRRERKNELSLPVTFGGQRLGTLRVGPKRGGALFSYDDLDLLHTIANQGALALAHAHAYRELEARRRQQAAAWRGEREALVETVAAEIAHEVRYPLNFFRTSFERLARSEALDAEDVDIGREEIDRLERMVSGLRRLAAHRMQRKSVKLLELCERAEVLLRDALGERRVELDAAPDVELRCDPDQAGQILVNLLSNALEAAGPEGEVGVALALDDIGAELRVWDTGAGFVGDASRLFAPWYTTKERGTGLGLAITHRLVRAHGWNVSASRQGKLTVFAIRIPRTDLRPGRSEPRGKVQVA